MEASLVTMVWERAANRCEYCLIPQEFFPVPFEIDHIIARQHGGRTVAGNLALSCFHCNAFKGPNIAGIDPVSGKLVPLFHPRRHRWKRHFSWKKALLLGRTPIGRATIQVLNMNDLYLVSLREELLEEGWIPS